MKKIIALLLVLSLAFCFVACNKDEPTPETPAPQGPTTQEPTMVTYKLATATISKELTTRSSSKIANNFAVVIFDATGKVVAARFDSIETAHPTVTDGAIVLGDVASKVESGYNGGGKMSDTWGNQAKAVENYFVGKTAAEIGALEITKELIAGCTMVSTSYSSALDLQALVVKAAASTKMVEFKVEEGTALTLGLGVDASAAFNRSGNIEFTANCAGTVLAGGKVVAAIVDSTVQTYTVADGVVTNPTTYTESKLVQGDDYGMLGGYGSQFAEWYVQAQNYANLAVGKTVAELANLSTNKTELAGVCTMASAGYKAVLVEAATNAR